MSALAASNLTVERGGREILKLLDVAFRSGQVTALLGPNGAGKSTLLAGLAGLLRASHGAVTLDQEDLSTLKPQARSRRIGFLPQNPEIAWPIDVQTLVALGRIQHRQTSSSANNTRAIAEAMRITDTSQWASRDVTSLSGGERARALLARVLAGEPEWILADEPFAGLDPAHQFEACELFRTLAASGRGVIVTLHDLTLAARVADRVVVMVEGRIIADDAPREAMSRELLRKAYGIEAQWVHEDSQGSGSVIAILGRHRG